jgi:hypothetical protein
VLLEDGSKANTDEGDVVNQFNDGQLIYLPRNPRIYKGYGFSPIEQIYTTINIGLRRQAKQLLHFTDGNIPPGLLNSPEGWSPSQIAEYQEWFNSILAGNLQNQTRLIWGPFGAKYQPFTEPPYKDEFDEWLARIVCYAFSLPPSAFTPHSREVGSIQCRSSKIINTGCRRASAWSCRSSAANVRALRAEVERREALAAGYRQHLGDQREVTRLRPVAEQCRQLVELCCGRVVAGEPRGALQLADKGVERAVLIVRRAKIAQAGMRLALDMLRQRGGQARLADARLPGDQHHPPCAELRLLPAPQQGLCHGNERRIERGQGLIGSHAAATASNHCAAASALKIRSVDREMRWR